MAWSVRVLGGRIPALRRTAVDDLIAALDETTSSDTPLYVDVIEGERGERVQIYIG